jgi:hypothetical protein
MRRRFDDEFKAKVALEALKVLSGKCNDPGSARELTHINPSRL